MTNRLQEVAARLSEVADGEENLALRSGAKLPSVDALQRIVALAREVIFPGFFDKGRTEGSIRTYYIGAALHEMSELLCEQIAKGLAFGGDKELESVMQQATDITNAFVAELPEIKRLLYTDVEAMVHNDPAVTQGGEVIFCYPMMIAMTHHRIAHRLLRMGVPVIPRIIAEMAHSQTGIDIHPGAQIGDHFCIDHGTGVVVGETCIIGSHVMLYQGVTLGAKSFTYGSDGSPLNLPRHPIIEDNVTIYSNTSILGRITIGHDTIVGGNVWQTRDVPPHSLILQGKSVNMQFTDGAGI